jgi:hypothetical protein
MATLTISEYIQACVGFDIPDNTLNAILAGREIEVTALISSVSKQSKELCCADAFRWALTKPSGSVSVSDSDAGWKHAESSASITEYDKVNWRKMANEIYARYGEPVITNKMRIRSL